MSYYSKPQIELLLTLINESNPGLLELRDLENTTIGVPFARTPKSGEIQDTSLELYANPETFYLGKQIVHYRRIDLGRLFANMTLELEYWQSANLSRAQWVEMINVKYGLQLVEADFIHYGNMGETTHTLTVAGTSLAYRGSFRIRWVRGKRALDQIFLNEAYSGLYWDRLFDENKPLMTVVNFGTDYSRFNNVNLISNGYRLNNSGTYSGDILGIIDWFNSVSGMSLDLNSDHTLPNGVKGLTLSRFTLPNANVPEANHHKFNRVLTISSTAASWFCGKILIHYNV